MRRLLAITAVAGAAFGFALPAHATVTCYPVVDAAGTHAGVCAGGWCPDVCFIVVDPYCYHDARSSVDLCTTIDHLG